MIWKRIARRLARIRPVQSIDLGNTPGGQTVELLEMAECLSLTARGHYRVFWLMIRDRIKEIADRETRRRRWKNKRDDAADEAVQAFYFWLRQKLNPHDFAEFKPHSTRLERYIKEHGEPQPGKPDKPGTDPADVFRYPVLLTPGKLIAAFKKMLPSLIGVRPKIRRPNFRARKPRTGHLPRSLWGAIDLRSAEYTDIIDTIPANLQTVAKMYGKGYSTADIAEALDISPQAVRRKRKKIRKILEESGFVS